MTQAVGMKSLVVGAPSRVLTNDQIRARYPELVRAREIKTIGRALTQQRNEAAPAFDAAVEPYLSDPFNGVVERRALAPGESGVGLEVEAGRAAVAQAGLRPEDIDLLISVGFLPDQIGIGNAVFVARELGLRGAAWNLETACAGALTAFQTACALIRAGEYRKVLVTVSCTYSTRCQEEQPISWFFGDAAGAFVVAEVEAGTGYLGAYSMHTADTCNTWFYDLALVDGAPRIVLGATERTGPVMRAVAEPHLKRCCLGAAERAGVSLDAIDFFVFHTPTIFFADFCASALGIDRERTTNIYRYYGNIGPALTPVNLHYAAFSRRIRPGQLVMVYGPGSSSSSIAVVMRWGDVALGTPPPGMNYDDRG